jgi:hypothetical protein
VCRREKGNQGVYFFILFYFLSGLLHYNLHTAKFTFFKCRVREIWTVLRPPLSSQVMSIAPKDALKPHQAPKGALKPHQENEGTTHVVGEKSLQVMYLIQP